MNFVKYVLYLNAAITLMRMLPLLFVIVVLTAFPMFRFSFAALPVMFVSGAVAPNAVFKITYALSDMLSGYPGTRVFMTVVTRVGLKLRGHNVAAGTVGRVIAVKLKIATMVETGGSPGPGSVALHTVVR